MARDYGGQAILDFALSLSKEKREDRALDIREQEVAQGEKRLGLQERELESDIRFRRKSAELAERGLALDELIKTGTLKINQGQLELDKEKLSANIDQATKAFGLDEKKLGLQEREVSLSESAQPTNLAYIAEQTLTMQARREIADEQKDLERQINVAKIRGARAEAKELEIKLQQLEKLQSLGNDELLNSVVFPQLAAQENAQLKNQVYAQNQVLQGLKLQHDISQFQATQADKQFNARWGGTISDLAGAPGGQSAIDVIKRYEALPDDKKTPDALMQVQETINKALDRKTEFELEKFGSQQEFQLQKEATATSVRELIGKPELFLNSREYNKYVSLVQQGIVPETEPADSGLLARFGFATNLTKLTVVDPRTKGGSSQGQGNPQNTSFLDLSPTEFNSLPPDLQNAMRNSLLEKNGPLTGAK